MEVNLPPPMPTQSLRVGRSPHAWRCLPNRKQLSALRLPLSAFLLALLVSCSKPAAPTPEPPPPEPSPSAEPAAVATPTPAVATPVSTPAVTPAMVSFEGTWTMKDEQGQAFDIGIFPNGQAVSNWTKGPSGARGERGIWRQDANKLLIFFHDGWTDEIEGSGDGFVHRGFEPGASPAKGSAKNSSAATRVEGHEFTGVWRLNQEPDGSFLYIALQSSGRAMSTIGGGTEGTWEQTAEGALCQWPDGWNDLIFSTEEGFQKRSWVGADADATPWPDVSPSLRVGDAKFTISP